VAHQACSGALVGGGRRQWLLGVLRAVGLPLDLRTGTGEAWGDRSMVDRGSKNRGGTAVTLPEEEWPMGDGQDALARASYSRAREEGKWTARAVPTWRGWARTSGGRTCARAKAGMAVTVVAWPGREAARHCPYVGVRAEVDDSFVETAHAWQTTVVASGEHCRQLVDERFSASCLSRHHGVQRRSSNVSKSALGGGVLGELVLRLVSRHG
jgi:hypothetical protein